MSDERWERLRDRLADVRSAYEEGEGEGERARAVMDARARAAAEPLERDEDRETCDLLIAKIGARRIAIETRHVSEVVRAPAITPLPGVPPLWLGVHNLRGTLLPVFDLGLWLGGTPVDEGGAWAVVLGGARPDIAAWVSEVIAIQTHPLDDLLDPAGVLGREHPRLKGVLHPDIHVLDGDMLLSHPTLILDQGGPGRA